MDDSKLIERKFTRAKQRGYYSTVDLFSGCGGMSLGFERANFKTVAAVEIDNDARMSHALNFNKGPNYASFSDILETSPVKAVEHLFLPVNEAIDVLIGGPPCQAFSRLGRARLWQLAGKKMAHSEDKRATMYQYFLEYVRELKPIVFVMENVREIGKYCGRNIAEEIALFADDLGYNVRYSLLNAVWYGTPQLRERAFIVGIHKTLEIIPTFPSIKFEFKIPTGYSTSREGKSELQFIEPNDHFIDNHTNQDIKSKAVTLGDAFADLPPITEHLKELTSTKKPQDPNQRTNYLTKIDSFIIKQMREWPGFESSGDSFTGHIIRKTPRDYNIFRLMPSGGMYPDAYKTALNIFEKEIKKLKKKSGKTIKKNSKEWMTLYKQIVPPYSIDKYPNKFRKLWEDQPSRTLPAHIGKDSYSHIHFDSKQARGISLREAARIQSFPDAFQFHGSMNSQLKQIGNAVPPLLAFAVAEHIQNLLGGIK